MVVPVTMDLFQHRYYKLNKIFMMLIGQWPYQSNCARYSIIAVSLFLGVSISVPQILALVKYRDDGTIIMDCILPFSFGAMCMTKFISFMCNSEKTIKLLNRIRTDWHVWAQHQEINVLHEYVEQGRRMTILYTVGTYLTVAVFMSQPTVTNIIDIFLNNGSKPRKFPFPVDYYYLDTQKYYFYLNMYFCVCALIISTTAMASDVMLIIYVQHGCGIFAALGYRLERIGQNDRTERRKKATYALKKREMDFEDVVSCIDRHNDAIEYAKLIEANYTWIFFIVIGLGMIMVNITGLQILMRKTDPEATTKFIILILGELGQFFMGSYICQNLMDHSISIRFYIYNSQWYRLSLKAQKLLQLMTMRCNIPCQLTAGNFFVMSVRTAGMASKTCMSYFTLMRSMQGL